VLEIRASSSDVARSDRDVCLSVCHDREPCKKAEPIEMPFEGKLACGP